MARQVLQVGGAAQRTGSSWRFVKLGILLAGVIVCNTCFPKGCKMREPQIKIDPGTLVLIVSVLLLLPLLLAGFVFQ
ncbi:hypothetical protein DP116_17310 [Brasilonema bromeliae SPC951]|uniref:Uncharacterized protein n=1 Tax=Brasilonema bromeliae SPC951 TaxID=385972 RepID=A0ABX1PC86_9CYAN|nr:hypothetical protein [Brasilonema bromeliae SPC951]